MLVMLIAGFWGFAEATFFFLIPDILLTYLAIRFGLRKALLASIYAVCGAVFGGFLMYRWGVRSEEAALAFLDAIPAIGPEMFATVQGHLQDHGVMGLFLGSANGIPYKIYAVNAPAQAVPFHTFLLMSFPARMYRFLIVCFLAASFGYLSRSWPGHFRYGPLAVFWIVSYAIYFYHFL